MSIVAVQSTTLVAMASMSTNKCFNSSFAIDQSIATLVSPLA